MGVCGCLVDSRVGTKSETALAGTKPKCADRCIRKLLYEAANVMLTRHTPVLKLKDRSLALANRSTMRKGLIALARTLATYARHASARCLI